MSIENGKPVKVHVEMSLSADSIAALRHSYPYSDISTPSGLAQILQTRLIVEMDRLIKVHRHFHEKLSKTKVAASKYTHTPDTIEGVTIETIKGAGKIHRGSISVEYSVGISGMPAGTHHRLHKKRYKTAGIALAAARKSGYPDSRITIYRLE